MGKSAIRAALLGALVLAGGAAAAEAPPVLSGAQPALQQQTSLQARVRASALPRRAEIAPLPARATIPPDQLHALTALAMRAYFFEAEDWGEIPELGFTVQDMSGWGSQWSGNRQIFWNPQAPGNVFKWDFAAPGGRILRIHLTGAPDYADLVIRLGCYRKLGENQYQLAAQRTLSYNGRASQVVRRQVAYPLYLVPQCRTADALRLVFTANPVSNRKFAGIDAIEVSR